MKTLLMMISLLVIAQQAQAAHYYRFWRGHIAPKMTAEKFVKGLNEIFIPETVEQGRGHGLISYLPVLIDQKSSISEFPDELALVVYESEEKYQEIRKMPRGSNYQKMHWDYFDKSNSRSRVPERFTGDVEVEDAYDLLQSNSDWQKGRVQYLMRKFKTGFSSEVERKLKKHFKSVKRNAKKLGIKSYLVLVDQLGIYEYILYDSSAEPRGESLLKSAMISTEMNILLKSKNEEVDFGEGVNRQFAL